MRWAGRGGREGLRGRVVQHWGACNALSHTLCPWNAVHGWLYVVIVYGWGSLGGGDNPGEGITRGGGGGGGGAAP